jgi:hypothetical protein
MSDSGYRPSPETQALVARAAWMGYPGMLVFAIIMQAGNGTALPDAARNVVLGPLWAGGWWAMVAGGMVCAGLVGHKNILAVTLGMVGVVLWILLGVLGGGLSMT